MTALGAFAALYGFLCCAAGVYTGWNCYDEQPMRSDLGTELRWLHYPIGFLVGAVALLPILALIGFAQGARAVWEKTK